MRSCGFGDKMSVPLLKFLIGIQNFIEVILILSPNPQLLIISLENELNDDERLDQSATRLNDCFFV
ncbi:hypothetical protein PNK_1280 [Candidatus Protochlamydia naegleriophila]|uniref:Uncharacterized protein n=1 Tax=Candidatus Protochlamydia naegleriophila TaxID=389348 RepID=A0A0U5ERZ5_9BACT|nr:hypothetical protein PNK_1280 [Candidatus Protochlamydia naegleriophila]